MRIEVTAQVVYDDGSVMYGYSHIEAVVPGSGSPKEGMLEVGQQLMDQLEAAEKAIGGQIARTADMTDA